MKTIYEAKQLIKDNYNCSVVVKVKGARNKNETIKGIITECYRNVFVVNTNKGKKSFSYTDILVGNVVLKSK